MNGKLRKRAFERDDYQCRNCGQSGDETSLVAHHIVPRIMGGKDKLSNLATLCESCHDNVHTLTRLSDQALTKKGIQRAKNEGKWVGQVPAGFVRVDGYLRPNLSPDYSEGETGYHDIVDALEQLEAEGSYRGVAKETPNVSRQTLMNIDKDEERRAWYLGGEIEDGRVDDAVAEVRD